MLCLINIVAGISKPEASAWLWWRWHIQVITSFRPRPPSSGWRWMNRPSWGWTPCLRNFSCTSSSTSRFILLCLNLSYLTWTTSVGELHPQRSLQGLLLLPHRRQRSGKLEGERIIWILILILNFCSWYITEFTGLILLLPLPGSSFAEVSRPIPCLATSWWFPLGESLPL